MAITADCVATDGFGIRIKADDGDAGAGNVDVRCECATSRANTTALSWQFVDRIATYVYVVLRTSRSSSMARCRPTRRFFVGLHSRRAVLSFRGRSDATCTTRPRFAGIASAFFLISQNKRLAGLRV